MVPDVCLGVLLLLRLLLSLLLSGGRFYVFLRARPFSLSSALAKGSEQHFSCLSLASHARISVSDAGRVSGG